MSGGDSGGRVIDGRFALEARLGGGGMGMVWRARDLVLDRAVALKEVRPPDPALAEYDPEAARLLRARVLREARALARVEHPNVVTIHHVVDGGDDTYPWLVMELVTGGSLQDRLARGPMAPAEAATLGREVLAALRAAHGVGIQHRDVKPANVLLRPDGRPVLTDFGIAAIRESTALTATGSIIGTPDYMAPERITGDNGGPGSDLWSLAMMLYVAVEGHHPLRRATTLATLAAVLNETLPPPERAGALTPVLAALLVKDPAARPDPETFDRMLASVVEGVPIQGVPIQGLPIQGLPVQGGTTQGGAAPGGPPTTAPFAAPGTAATGSSAAPGFGPPGSGTPVSASPPVPDAAPGTGAPTPPAFGPPSDGTSYRLTPPAGAAAGNPYTQGGADPYGVTSQGRSPQDQRIARRFRRIAVGTSAVSIAVTAALVWQFLPEGTDGDSGDSVGAGAGSRTPSATTPSPSGGDRASDEPAADGPPSGERTSAAPSSTAPRPGGGATDLLTPDGIRLAVAAIEKETGTDRVGRFTVYPEHISANVLLKGSDKRYDSYTYRVGRGLEKGIISGSLASSQQPMDLDDFDWDVLPALLKRAEKDLNVKEPTARYLVVNEPIEVLDTPVTLGVYFSDKYDGGYLTADLDGKVRDIYPAES
ncbi:protein kinase [Streptomyces uncialis]|uniref:serine/threonine-protein kinase n=1 Tax=Streptomyces uncialis TaxID=1048205 RepID=UPI002E339415|nr:protein kinase [Streptomyces uncialis]